MITEILGCIKIESTGQEVKESSDFSLVETKSQPLFNLCLKTNKLVLNLA